MRFFTSMRNKTLQNVIDFFVMLYTFFVVRFVTCNIYKKNNIIFISSTAPSEAASTSEVATPAVNSKFNIERQAIL